MSGIYAVFPESIRREAEEEIRALLACDLNIAFRSGSGEDDTARLTAADGLLVILGETNDTENVKQDLNLALDRHLPVVMIYFGTPVPDRGLLIQLGLAERFPAGEQDRERTVRALQNMGARPGSESGSEPGTEKKGSRRAAVWAALLLAAALMAGTWFLFPKFFPEFSGRGEESGGALEESSEAASTEASVEAADLSGELREALLLAGADLNGDGEIELSELTSLTELTLSDCGLSDIRGLSLATGLTKLDLSGNTITDISELAALRALEELDLSGNAITDISALAALTELKKLDLTGNPVEDLRILDFLDLD